MKKCSDVENLLPLYPEGILSETEKRIVEEHLADCAKCRKELAYLQKASQMVDDLPAVEEPPWFQQKIMAQVRREAREISPAQKWFDPLRIKIPVQIMATLIIAILAVYIYRSGDERVGQILPGSTGPVVEMQKEQAPAPMREAGDQAMPAVPRKKSAVREEAAGDRPVMDKSMALSGVEKSEAPDAKPGVAYEAEADRAKGSAKRKDEVLTSLQTRQSETRSAKAVMPDQEKKTEDRSVPAMAKKKDDYKMAAPSAPQSMGASAAFAPQARVFIRVDDLNVAVLDVETLLVKYDAKKLTKQASEGGVVILAEVAGQNWKAVLMKLKGIGRAEEKVTPADTGERGIQVMIEISDR